MKLLISDLFLPYDVYSRHQRIAELIAVPGAILDVGGSLKELHHFVSNPLTTVDVIGGDVIYNGIKLPFKDKSFSTVVSIDTLEHIPNSRRTAFLAELARVAQKQIILAAPMGTTTHIESELKLLKHYPDDTYLQEHVKYGLPTLVDIKYWLENFPNHHLSFSDDFRFANLIFQFHHFEVQQPQPNRLIYYFKPVINLFVNSFLFPFLKDVAYTQTVNRFILKIDLS